MSSRFDGKQDSSNQRQAPGSWSAATRSVHKERREGYNANWTKGTPKRAEIKTNGQADRRTVACLRLQAASRAAQLLFWPL